MSLYNVLRTGTSGMEAQATKLGTVAENIANANTVGYKRADAEFSTLVLESSPNDYSSGAVTANIRRDVTTQGALTYTLSKTDIAVEGNGFFVVQDRNGGDFLTRAGSFVLDGQSGNLVNAAGFSLLGVRSTPGEDTAITLNDTGGMETINLDVMNMRAAPSTLGEYRVNLDSRKVAIEDDNTAPVTGAVSPANNGVDSAGNPVDTAFTVKSSIITFDDLGTEVTLDVYWTKIREASPGVEAQWEVVVYDQAQANSSVGVDFPYGQTEPPTGLPAPAATDPAYLARAVVDFSSSTGAITQIDQDGIVFNGTTFLADPAAVTVDPDNLPQLQLALPNATEPLTLDLDGTTSLAADFEPLRVAVNGNAPATVQEVAIDNTGRVFAIYEDGAQVEFYRLPLANVPSPDQLDVLPGNIYSPTSQSGDLRIALPDDAGNGSLVVGALEQSNVDLGSELTDMIVTQRGFSANSRSFQTGDDLLELLINLGR
ncbi:MAG: flagellar hook protein FlgE [Pseudomonadota bacterium]